MVEPSSCLGASQQLFPASKTPHRFPWLRMVLPGFGGGQSVVIFFPASFVYVFLGPLDRTPCLLLSTTRSGSLIGRCCGKHRALGGMDPGTAA